MRSSRPELFCKNCVLANFAKFTKKHQKDIPLQMFSYEFIKISYKPFLKNPSDGYFCINIRPVYFPTTTFCLFKNDVAHFFSLNIFSVSFVGWEKKVSSICKTLSQKFNFNLFKHLRWSFSCEKVNSSTPLGIFAKKLHCRCSTMF